MGNDNHSNHSTHTNNNNDNSNSKNGNEQTSSCVHAFQNRSTDTNTHTHTLKYHCANDNLFNQHYYVRGHDMIAIIKRWESQWESVSPLRLLLLLLSLVTSVVDYLS
ncbi:unnamed protein product [Schistosoma curassoni]|uniref:Cation_ATPase_N domain-containing protein n=1 Tax=Schistosoma curassoni TaxID=6186 RepID=A0A183K391_9TREM|nr:unnamed protein product [Schistosoma curassoni]